MTSDVHTSHCCDVVITTCRKLSTVCCMTFTTDIVPALLSIDITFYSLPFTTDIVAALSIDITCWGTPFTMRTSQGSSRSNACMLAGALHLHLTLLPLQH